jgi:carboxypeptidase family protein
VRRILAVLLSIPMLAPAAGAQTSTIAGVVTSDSAGTRALGGALVTIIGTTVAARTNPMGEYRLSGLAPGQYVIGVQSIGYRPRHDTITVGFAETRRDFVLDVEPVKLDSVVSKAAAPRQWISPALRGFEERRTSGAGGYFISDSVLRNNENRTMADALGAYRAGIAFARQVGDAAYAFSTRNPKSGKFVFLGGGVPAHDWQNKPTPAKCYATVYLDGVLVYDLGLQPSNSPAPPPDINQYHVSDLAGVEFYAGGASTPIQFRSSGCGALLLWTREK